MLKRSFYILRTIYGADQSSYDRCFLSRLKKRESEENLPAMRSFLMRGSEAESDQLNPHKIKKPDKYSGRAWNTKLNIKGTYRMRRNITVYNS